jgi:hypothetical protein
VNCRYSVSIPVVSRSSRRQIANVVGFVGIPNKSSNITSGHHASSLALLSFFISLQLRQLKSNHATIQFARHKTLTDTEYTICYSLYYTLHFSAG